MKHQDYTVGWICALPTEMAAAEAMLDEHHHPLQQHPGDDSTYILGRVGVHNVVLACLPSGVTGTISAARVAMRMLFSFKKLRFRRMVGIGGGAPNEENDIRLGDIVVSEPFGTSGGVIQYDFGKTLQAGRFIRTGLLNRPPDILLTALATLKAKHLREGHELSNHLSQMVIRYPNMKAQFAPPDVQHDWLYEAEYGHPEGNRTCSQCDRTRLVN